MVLGNSDNPYKDGMQRIGFNKHRRLITPLDDIDNNPWELDARDDEDVETEDDEDNADEEEG